MQKISKATARKFLLAYQGLSGKPFRGKQGAYDFIRQVGCIQYDPLNVVGRNPDLVLQARIPKYNPKMLADLLYKDRLLMDGWDKMMSIHPAEDYAAMSHVRQARSAATQRYLSKRNINLPDHTETIYAALKENGPMQPGILELGTTPSFGWGSQRVASFAMEQLFLEGKLGIHSKKNTQKVYDFIENLLSEQHYIALCPHETTEDFIKWYVYRRIGSVGLLWNRSGGGWLGEFLENKANRTRAIEVLLSEGLLQEILIEDINEPFYMHTTMLPLLEGLPQPAAKVTFIAPLDNLLWDRTMVSQLFNFDYTWEVYVPEAKRKYGYYVLPVLYRDKLIARMEPTVHRGADPLVIKNWWWELSTKKSDALLRAIDDGLARFASYLGAREVQIDLQYKIGVDI